MKDKPSYYGILPANVRYDKRLKPMSRIMYAEITALSNKWGYCTANNRYFADLYEVSTATVSRWFSQLVKLGYVKIDIDKAKGNERKIYPYDQNVKTYKQKDQNPIDKKIKTPIDEKIIYNNTSINTTRLIDREDTRAKTTSLNSSSEIQKEKIAAKRKRFQPPTLEEVEAYMLHIVDSTTATKQASLFYNYYESNGWKVGRNKMKKWKSSASGWIGRMNNYTSTNIKNEKTNDTYGAARIDTLKAALAELNAGDY